MNHFFKFIPKGIRYYSVLTIGLLSLHTEVLQADVKPENEVQIHLYPQQASVKINKNIYGQFAEHLGTCIYGGIWVGPKSDIPNTQGYRNDVLEALRNLHIPVLRWPGGCFADEYHWMDGIGKPSKRPRMVNTNWGGTIEDNSFGTHEFLNLCELLNIEPYISGNVGSGTVEEMAKWVEYVNAESDSPMARLRRKNGRDKAWNVKYWGVGNESWGCGGRMTPEYYADVYKRYATYCRTFDGKKLFKIASGASSDDYHWTEVLMKKAGRWMNGLSLHYYTVDWNRMKLALDFNADEFYQTIGRSLEVDKLLQKHCQIMDKYDPECKVDLILDEWGTWWKEEPGTVPGHLYQQNTLRDAFVAALSLNVFHKYAPRLSMANIAQLANVLQAMVLTKGDKMVLTPTYHIFRMYKVHQDALNVPFDLICRKIKAQGGYEYPSVGVTASLQNNGKLHLSLSNIDLSQSQKVWISLDDINAKQVTGEILTSADIHDHNTFEAPDKVSPKEFTDCRLENGKLLIMLPAHSIVSLEITK